VSAITCQSSFYWTDNKKALACFVVVGGVELTLKPFGREFYKALGDAMVFTCELELSDEESQNDVAYTIQWFVVSSNREITDRTGRFIFVFCFRLLLCRLISLLYQYSKFTVSMLCMFLLAALGDGSAYHVGCVCLSLCNVDVLWLNAFTTDRAGFWYENCHKGQLFYSKHGFGSSYGKKDLARGSGVGLIKFFPCLLIYSLKLRSAF